MYRPAQVEEGGHHAHCKFIDKNDNNCQKNTKIAKKRDKNSPKMTMLLREGEEVDITCTVHASPPAIVTWMKGQAKLKSSGR